MRYLQLLSEQQLDEIRMSPTALKKFADSPEAADIQAGFEAELYFRDALENYGEHDDPEPDYDYNPVCSSIDDIIEFFSGDYNNRSDLHRLRIELVDAYVNWRDQVIDIRWHQKGLSYLTDWLAENLSEEEIYALANREYHEDDAINNEILGMAADEVWEDEDENWDKAKEEFAEEHETDVDEIEWLNAEDYHNMSDIENNFRISWPHWTDGDGGDSRDGEGFNLDIAAHFAADLTQRLGVPAQVWKGGGKDYVTWYFEADGSLRLGGESGSDMPCEITSPPMPLKECLAMMEKFWAWAEHNNAYTDDSTGFHMGLSFKVPDSDDSHANVDYVKLALFLGDKHVLNEFDRQNAHWCQSAVDKIRDRINTNTNTPEKMQQLPRYLEMVRDGMGEVAQKALGITSSGFNEKYTSINPHVKNYDRGQVQYIEFRGAGGDYLETLPKIQNTLLRYSKALAIANDPMAERREYATKLTKLFTDRFRGDPAMNLFAKYSAGEISPVELKREWANTVVDTAGQTDITDVPDAAVDPKKNTRLAKARNLLFKNDPTGNTVVILKSPLTKVYQFDSALDYRGNIDLHKATAIASSWARAKGISPEEFERDYRVLSTSRFNDMVNSGNAEIQPQTPQNNPNSPTIEYELYNLDTGEVVDTFPARNNDEALIRLRDYREHGAGQASPDSFFVRWRNDPSNRSAPPANDRTTTADYEFVNTATGEVVDRVTDVNQMQVSALRDNIANRLGVAPASIYVQWLPTIRESTTAQRVFDDFDKYFENIIGKFR